MMEDYGVSQTSLEQVFMGLLQLPKKKKRIQWID